MVAETDDPEESSDVKNSIHSVSPFVGLAVLIGLLGLFGIVYAIDSVLPTPITVADEATYPDSFVAERAQADLKLLTDIGPRVAGSYENEVLAVDFLRRQIEYIQHFSHVNQKMEFDIQVVSGSYFLEYQPHGSINSYGNVQNIVVRLEGKTSSNSSILINAHFDSVPTSPGGSDDGIMCAVMLEILRKLSRKPERLEHTLIFLFNGAEETPLQASHGFITKHKWAEGVKIMVNLEAAGAGSKEILFQTGPDHPWLINYYKNVPRPCGQAAGEEIFQSNVLPSDTDFRVFRDFGNIFGYDFAFARNGYRYHTKYDDFSNIPLGSYQHVGDNILSLLKGLGNAPELSENGEQSKEKIVYYDIFGLFMISYKLTIAYVVNIIVVVLSKAVALKAFWDFGLRCSLKSFKCTALTFCAILGGWISSAIFVAIVAFFLDGVGYSMSWYRNPWLVFGLFSVPTIACSGGIIALLNRFNKKLSVSALCQIQAHTTRLIWTLALFVGTVVGIRASYALLILVSFNSLGFLVIQIFNWQHSVRKWQIVYLISTIIPTMFVFYTSIMVSSLFIPITGRIGSDKNADMLIGLIIFFFTVLATAFYTPLITLVRKPKILLLTLFSVFVLFFIMVFTPLGFPYSGNLASPAPQRQWIHHTERKFFDESGELYKKDAGFFLLNMDRNSPKYLYGYVKEFKKAASIAKFCDDYLLCGLPVSHPKMVQIITKSTWIPSGPPAIHEPVSLKLNSISPLSSDVIRYSLTLTGPDHMNMYLSPKEGFKLQATNLTDKILDDHLIWKNRGVHFIKYGWGKSVTPLNFYLDIKTPQNWTGEPTMDIAVSGQNVHEKLDVYTREYKEFLNQFPDWADLMTGLASYEARII